MSESRVIGMVKWFNNKIGYGFITHENNDFFVHHQQLNVNNQYKYLVQGEYVHFTKKYLNEGPHKVMATLVTGVNGGPLVCETRQLAKETSMN